ncbi:MAG TPA: 2'-5' RNA ligase family protein [Xanthomonadaceae bacterium]
MPTDRLFLGLFPDQAASTRIEEVARHMAVEFGGSRPSSRASRFHVTVHHLGDHAGLDDALVDAAMAAIARIRAPTFDFTMDEVSGFRGGRKHPIVLRGRDGSPGAHELWRASRDVLVATVFARWLGRSYTPHLTLLYGDRLPASPIAVEPIVWAVGEMVLVHSLLGRSEYRILGRWPLVAG